MLGKTITAFTAYLESLQHRRQSSKRSTGIRSKLIRTRAAQFSPFKSCAINFQWCDKMLVVHKLKHCSDEIRINNSKLIDLCLTREPQQLPLCCKLILVATFDCHLLAAMIILGNKNRLESSKGNRRQEGEEIIKREN